MLSLEKRLVLYERMRQGLDAVEEVDFESLENHMIPHEVACMSDFYDALEAMVEYRDGMMETTREKKDR